MGISALERAAHISSSGLTETGKNLEHESPVVTESSAIQMIV